MLDKSRNLVPSCEKLNFYCNMKKRGAGNYEILDHVTPRVPTKCNGPRDDSVQEARNVSMRLLYRQVSTDSGIGDPRLERLNKGGDYPTRLPSSMVLLRGSGRGSGKGPKEEEWGSHWIIASYSSPSLNRPKGFNNNPHIIEEEDDVEVCEVVPHGLVVEDDDEDGIIVCGDGPDSPPEPGEIARRRRKNLGKAPPSAT